MAEGVRGGPGSRRERTALRPGRLSEPREREKPFGRGGAAEPPGDPSDALVRVAAAVTESDRPWPPARTIPEADTSGPRFTAEAILDAIDRGAADGTVYAPSSGPA
ncbi:hypothetical protein [Streptomyces sp. NPDC058683]|uniref:hypothetical protein n=1 Tax=Streptomyces sp. NPDC058683 TaxID=3346597 RepID=UPI003646E08F